MREQYPFILTKLRNNHWNYFSGKAIPWEGKSQRMSQHASSYFVSRLNLLFAKVIPSFLFEHLPAKKRTGCLSQQLSHPQHDIDETRQRAWVETCAGQIAPASCLLSISLMTIDGMRNSQKRQKSCRDNYYFKYSKTFKLVFVYKNNSHYF